jgi:hypothetical protein
MLNELNHFLNARADDGVSDAVLIASAFVAAREGSDGGKDPALRKIARESRLRHSQVRALFQPSRRPKAIPVGFLRRLKGAYLDYLRRKLLEIENDIKAIEGMDAADRAGEALLHRAEAVVSQIKAVTSIR